MHIQVPILCLLLVSNGKFISHATEVLPSCYRELLKPTKPTNVATKTVFILVNFPWYLIPFLLLCVAWDPSTFFFFKLWQTLLDLGGEEAVSFCFPAPILTDLKLCTNTKFHYISHYPSLPFPAFSMSFI